MRTGLSLPGTPGIPGRFTFWSWTQGRFVSSIDEGHLHRRPAGSKRIGGQCSSTRHAGTDDSGGDRATLGRGTARNHRCQRGRSRSARHVLDCAPCRSAVATSVRFGGRGGSASHEATTAAKAKSSRSGSASTTARNSSLATTSDLAVTMTGHTETGRRSSAVAEITCESPAGDTAGCSSVETVILRGLARSATGIVSRSTPLL